MDWKNLKMILVEWEDAASIDQWEPVSDALNEKKRLSTVKTCGFLLEENMEHILVALNLDVDGESVSQRLAIPCSCITKVVNLCEKIENQS